MPAGVTYFRGPKNRLTWPKWPVRVVNGTGSDRVAGDVMRFNTLFSDGTAVSPTVDPTDYDPRVGVASGIFGTTAKFVSASLDHEACLLACVCAEDIRAGQEGLAYVSGFMSLTVNGVGSQQLDPGVPVGSVFNYGDGSDGEACGSSLQVGTGVKCLGILCSQYLDGSGGNVQVTALVSSVFGFGSVG